MTTTSQRARVGQRELEPDFRPVIGTRMQATGPAQAYDRIPGRPGQVATASPADVDRAVAAARAAFGAWRELAPMARRQALMALADAIDQAAPELGALDCLDMGKPLATAEQEAHVAAFIVRWYAEAIDKVFGDVVASHPAALAYSQPVPYGVVGAVIAWNYPVINAAMKIAPALAAGNAIVLKPSEHAPLSALRLADLASAAGLPAGLVCVVHGGPAAGEALCAHDGVDMLAFTGSTPTGQRVASIAAPQLKPLILECGGKNPILVAEDVDDVAAIVRELVGEAFANTGQLCVARSKLIVPRARRSDVLEALQAALASVRTGDPCDAATVYGPLAHAGHALAVERGIAQAVAGGAQLLRDGRAALSGSVHCAATLLEAEAPESPALAHEYFGPVLTLYAYDRWEQAIEAANAGGWGLAATAWTQDLRRARSLTRRLRAGHIVVRAAAGVDAGTQMALPVEPTGRSGYGIEFGTRALESYSRRQAVQYLGLDAHERTRS